jgi:hypothetical protein
MICDKYREKNTGPQCVKSRKVIFSMEAKFCQEAKDGYGLELRLQYAAARH